MLLESRTVHVPAQAEIDDKPDDGGGNSNTRRMVETAEAGKPL